MWIIEAESKNGEKVYRVDRKKYPYMKWSKNIAHAFQFYKEEIATLHCSYYKFGNPRVREISKADEFMIGLNN